MSYQIASYLLATINVLFSLYLVYFYYFKLKCLNIENLNEIGANSRAIGGSDELSINKKIKSVIFYIILLFIIDGIVVFKII